MILPISALARSSCNSENIFEAIGPGSPQAVRSCVFEEKNQEKCFFQRPRPLSLALLDRLFPLFGFAIFPQPEEICQRQNPWQNWELCRTAKASHFGRGVCGADGEGKDAAKEPDTQRYAPCLSEPSYRNAAGVISPGLPSQALTRQLPQSGSPWQRGFVFDETDWGLLENVTECQSLPY